MEKNIKDIIEEILSKEHPKVDKLRRIYESVKESTYLSHYRALIHLTHLDNLESILENGLIPTRPLKENGYVLNGKKIKPGYGYSYAEDTVCMFYTDDFIYSYFEEIKNTNVGVVISPSIKFDEGFINEEERKKMGRLIKNEVNFKRKIDLEYIREIFYYAPRVKFEDVFPVAKKFKKPLIKILHTCGGKSTIYSWLPDIGIDEDISEYANIYKFVVRFYDELKKIDSTIDDKINKEELVVNYGSSIKGIEEKIVKGGNIPEIEGLINRFNLKKPRILAEILEERILERAGFSDRDRYYRISTGAELEEKIKICELWLEAGEKDKYEDFVTGVTKGVFYALGYRNFLVAAFYELTQIRTLSGIDNKDALRELVKKYAKEYGESFVMRGYTFPFVMQLCKYFGLREEYEIFNKGFRDFLEWFKVDNEEAQKVLERGKELAERLLKKLDLGKSY